MLQHQLNFQKYTLLLFLIILLLNFGLISFSFTFDNEFLKYNSYWFYGFQVITMFPYLLLRTRYVYSLFTPSILILAYLLISMFIGSIFVPHGYGFLTMDFIDDVKSSQNYNFIVFYWLSINIILFILSINSINKSNKLENVKSYLQNKLDSRTCAFVFSMTAILFFVSSYKVIGSFGIQMGVLLLCVLPVAKSNSFMKYIIYIILMIIMVKFNSENKREIIMALMVIIFCDSFFSQSKFNFTIQSVFKYVLLLFMFILLVLIASIFRGYGSYEVTSFFSVFQYLLPYIQSDIFVDAILDNFEISHTYPAAILPLEHIISGRMDLQAGLTIVKTLFLPIPREIFPYKPESAITLFTSIQSTRIFEKGGSFPVPLPAELFMNFHVFGLFAIYVIFKLLNMLFEYLTLLNPRGLRFKLAVVFCILFFIVIRGGGFELAVLTLLFSSTVLTLSCVKKFKIQL